MVLTKFKVIHETKTAENMLIWTISIDLSYRATRDANGANNFHTEKTAKKKV